MTDNAISGDCGAMPRRSILAGLAGIAASAACVTALEPAEAASADPIFAAIERHRAAWAHFNATCHTDDEIDAGVDILNGFETALTTIRPTTLAGAAALIEYGLTVDDFDEPKYGEDHSPLAVAASNIAALIRSMA